VEGKSFQTLETDCVGAQRFAAQESPDFQCLEKPGWIDIQPNIHIDGNVATLTFDLQVPTLKTAFILVR